TDINAAGDQTKCYFDASDRPCRLVDKEGSEWLRDYDERGRLVKKAGPLGIVWTFEYAPEGYVSRCVGPQGGEIRQVRSRDGSNASFRGSTGLILAWHYDAAGNVLSIANGKGIRTHYAYDLV